MKVLCTHIKWDTDGEVVDLPTEFTVTLADDAEADTEAADALSDEFGFCILSLCIEVK